MKKLHSFVLALLMLMLPFALSAQDNHGAKGGDHDHEGETAPELFFTKITDNIEVYVGIQAPSVGSDIHFHINLTDILTYKPIIGASASVTIGSSTTKESTSKDGVCHYGMKFETAGTFDLLVNVTHNGKTTLFNMGPITVYPSLHDAIHENDAEPDPEQIALSKKYMWENKFGVEVIKKGAFNSIIKTRGEILPSNASETFVVAPTAGVVVYGKSMVPGRALKAGESLGEITGNGLESNVSSRYEVLKAEYESAKRNYERNKELFKDKIVSEKVYNDSYNQYLTAEKNFSNLSRMYTKTGVSVTVPTACTVSKVLVRENQYVEPGTVLAVVQLKRANMLKINVSKFHYKDIKNIYDANFIPEYADETMTVSALGGMRLANEVSTVQNSAYIPVYFSLPVNESIVPYSYAEIFAKVRTQNDEITVPTQALLENEGLYWVYVQVGGEKFMKRDVTIGKSDGKRTIIKSGLKEGDIVVTDGSHKIRQAEKSGAPMDHGHSH